MSTKENEHQEIPFIRELCAHLSEEELVEAEERFWRYVELAWRIFEREQREQSASRFDTDEPQPYDSNVTK